MSGSVYLVVASNYGDHPDVLKGFLCPKAATEFKARCEAHHRKRPECPPAEDTPENDALWEKYNRDQKRWEKRHPGGEGAIFRSDFSVQEVPLVPLAKG